SPQAERRDKLCVHWEIRQPTTDLTRNVALELAQRFRAQADRPLKPGFSRLSRRSRNPDLDVARVPLPRIRRECRPISDQKRNTHPHTHPPIHAREFPRFFLVPSHCIRSLTPVGADREKRGQPESEPSTASQPSCNPPEDGHVRQRQLRT
ncbi:hypothetical protein CH063_00384, partial [Colletotrichum higginsianum]